MGWLTDRHSFLIAVIIYGISGIYSVFLWRQGFRRDNRINYCLLLLGFVFHTLAMVERGFSLSQCPIHNLFEAIMFIDWTMVTVYLAIGLWARLRFLGAFASPVLFAVGVFALMPALDGPESKIDAGHFWTSLHATLVLLACGTFGLGFVAGLMFLTQEHDLKYHKLRAISSLLPPIQRMERTMGRLLLIGFILLTAGLLIGVLNMEQIHLVLKKEDPIILWSWVVWSLYLILLIMRWRFAQRGRRFAWGAIVGFLFIFLTFWGFFLLSPIHNP